MKRITIAAVALLLCGSTMADTFYLHADMPANSTPNDRTLWYNDPTGGVTQESLEAPNTGNRFDMNGYIFRSQNSSGSATFSGTVVVGAAGSASGVGFLLYTGTWNAAGLDVNNDLLIRSHRVSTSMVIQDLTVGGAGALAIRTLTGNNNVSLSAANISGSGSIEFGQDDYANDTNGVWSLSITDASPEFAGSVDLTRGQLTFGNAFALNDATLAINSAEDNSIVLANNVSFSNVTFGASVLDEGTYTAAQLNTEFSTDIFSGTETLTVIPEPATIGMLGLGALATLLVRRGSRA